MIDISIIFNPSNIEKVIDFLDKNTIITFPDGNKITSVNINEEGIEYDCFNIYDYDRIATTGKLLLSEQNCTVLHTSLKNNDQKFVLSFEKDKEEIIRILNIKLFIKSIKWFRKHENTNI